MADPRAILLALARGRRLSRRIRLSYRDPGGETTARDVEVLGLRFSDERWYAFVHCQHRHAVRLLRVDRVLAARPTRRRARASPPPGFDPAFFASVDYLEPGAPVAHLASIRLTPPLAEVAGALFPSAITEHEGEAVLCHVRASRPAVLALLVKSLGPGATLLLGAGPP